MSSKSISSELSYSKLSNFDKKRILVLRLSDAQKLGYEKHFQILKDEILNQKPEFFDLNKDMVKSGIEIAKHMDQQLCINLFENYKAPVLVTNKIFTDNICTFCINDLLRFSQQKGELLSERSNDGSDEDAVGDSGDKRFRYDCNCKWTCGGFLDGGVVACTNSNCNKTETNCGFLEDIHVK